MFENLSIYDTRESLGKLLLIYICNLLLLSHLLLIYIYKLHWNTEDCREFEACYDMFLLTQSEAIELNNRVFALKEACEHFKLTKIDFSGRSSALLLPSLTGGSLAEASQMSSSIMSQDTRQHLDVNSKQILKQLDEAREEIEELRTELFRAEQKSDKTPGALLFFSALYDPAAVSSIHAMIHEMKGLRRVAECEEHVDFTVLRQRILICISNAPPVERLLLKFSRLHSSWTQSRAKMFSIRNQAGGT